jgi:hypothetical protein
MARLIPSQPPADQNKSEGVVRDFLRYLPDDCIIYQELKLNVESFTKHRTSIQKRPDFIVVSPELGLVSIEVKDWNIDRNQYEWVNQQWVKKTAPNGQVSDLKNPFDQADDYLHALMGIIRESGIERDIWVTSLVIFPFITQQGFLNKIKNPKQLSQAGSKPLFDINVAIFRNEIGERHDDPAFWIRQKTRKSTNKISERTISIVNNTLIPEEFVIGDITRKQKERAELRLITERQEEWIMNLDQNANYLLDVAGSGKTNALISKAIHLTKHSIKKHQTPEKILLVSYNHTLAQNIKAIYSGKTTTKDRQILNRYIDVFSFIELMREIAAIAYGIKPKTYSDQYYNGDFTKFRETLLDDVRAAIAENPEKYREYGHIFIDEIQDFADEEIEILLDLCKNQNFFFVGDVGQRIKQDIHNMNRQSIEVTNIDLPKSYQMYRTPRYIAELAHRFVTNDATINREFEDKGYRQDAEFVSQLSNGAELVSTQQIIADLSTKVQDIVASGVYTFDDILVITHRNRVNKMRDYLEKNSIKTRKGYEFKSDALAVVSFEDSKGLEYEVVLIYGIEDLPHSDVERFSDTKDLQLRQAIARRLIYIALTRTLEECVVFYKDNTHPFIVELLKLDRKLLQKRQKEIQT